MLLHPGCKEPPTVFFAVRESEASYFSFYNRYNTLNLFITEELGNFSWENNNKTMHSRLDVEHLLKKSWWTIKIKLIITSNGLFQTDKGCCRFWMSPEAKKRLIQTRICSSGICASVKSKAMRWFLTPIFRNKPARSIWNIQTNVLLNIWLIVLVFCFITVLNTLSKIIIY